MAILKSVPGIEVERSTALKYVEVVPDKGFTIRITTDKCYKWNIPYIVMDIMVDSEELRDEIEDDVSRLEKTGEVKVGLYRAKSVKMLSATQARKHCPIFWKQPELNDRLVKDVHWDAISGRLKCQSQIATLGPGKPIVDPCIRTIYDVKYLDFDRSGSIKTWGVYKLRYRSEESLKALLVIRWDNAAIKREPIIKLESDDEEVAEDVTGFIVKREHDEDLAESSMPATKSARPRGDKR